MSESLYPYYERELLFIRQLAQEFAKQYPAAAGRLALEPNRSLDPHVERLIEAFALLTARVHHKLDDEFPELTDAMLGVLYPHYLRPVPSCSIVQFNVEPVNAQMPRGFLIDRHSRLHTQPVNGLPCTYRTGYPVTLWPIAVTGVHMLQPPFPRGFKPPAQTVAALRLQLECQGEMSFAELEIDQLRFYLNGDKQVIANLYELLFNHTLQVALAPKNQGPQMGAAQPITLTPAQCLEQVGFEKDEGLLPYPNQSFFGYRLVTEFFAFPSKFLFLDLGGFDGVRKAGFGKKLDVIFYLNRTVPAVEQGVDGETFCLGCTPVVNLFEKTAEPIPLTHTRSEYLVTPDVGHPLGMEIYSVDAVKSTDTMTGTGTDYEPFYSFRHDTTRDQSSELGAFWHVTRRATMQEGDRGTNIFLNLVDGRFDPHLPAETTLVIWTTCTNRDLPAVLQRAGEDLRFDLESAAPLKGIRCLRAPSLPLRPPVRRGGHWRLVAHLKLNHLSIGDVDDGRNALQEILRLYDFSDPDADPQLAAVTRQIIEGIVSVTSRRAVGRTGRAVSSGFCRGIEVTVEFDEQKYVGTGVFLFACILERFLGLYTSINSFSQLVGKTRQGEAAFKKWPPRAGEQRLS